MDLTPEEVRVLGALVEKQRTTPDQYPLSLNALRLACNQATNRDPVVEYDEGTIRVALERLGRRRWVRLASGAGSRATKYRHLLDEALGLDRPELAVLTVLMLRGPQTPGELRSRTERLHRFEGPGELRAAIDALVGRDLAASAGRRPGQKEERFRHLLVEDEDAPEADTEPPVKEMGSVPLRLARLEAQVAELQEAVQALSEGVHPGPVPVKPDL
ncbi:MAG TPA: YceH family protein [Thermoleophilaceae bacterium]|nr:YceH family protein [Thermoleophilaceae bacterium]